MNWPKTIKIGPHDWPVEITKEDLISGGKQVGGYVDMDAGKIKINPGFQVEFRLLEEIAHCISDVLDIEDTDDTQHHALRQYVMQVLIFIRDNADFVRNLTEKIESGNDPIDGRAT